MRRSGPKKRYNSAKCSLFLEMTVSGFATFEKLLVSREVICSTESQASLQLGNSLPSMQKCTIGKQPQKNEIHILKVYFATIHFNIILKSMVRISKWFILLHLLIKLSYKYLMAPRMLHVPLTFFSFYHFNSNTREQDFST